MAASTIERRQAAVLAKFTASTIAALQDVVAVEYAAGLGGRLDRLRHGREANRPPLVAMQAKPDGLFLSLTVSRPANGRMVYGANNVLGRWDFSVPLRRSPLRLKNPQHRTAIFWGLNLAEKLIAAARDKAAGDPITAFPFVWPRLLVSFRAGMERFDAEKHAANPGALVDSSVAGTTLVDASVVPTQFVAAAINDNTILEDYSHVAGEFVPAPAVGVPHLRPWTQIVAPDELRNPPWPYGGSGLPADDWRPAARTTLPRVAVAAR